jgi:hypothetical protein
MSCESVSGEPATTRFGLGESLGSSLPRCGRLLYDAVMTRSVRELLGAVLALPEDERIEFAAELLASVPGPPDPDWDTAWLAELDRRSADAGPSNGDNWFAVRERIIGRLRSR